MLTGSVWCGLVMKPLNGCDDNFTPGVPSLYKPIPIEIPKKIIKPKVIKPKMKQPLKPKPVVKSSKKNKPKQSRLF